MRRTITAVMIAIGLSVAAVTAVTNVTFVLTNGQRHSGTLVYKGTGEIGLVSGGQERMFPISDLAAILYSDGAPTGRELEQLPTTNNPPDLERHTLVLRDGRIIKGKVWHWNPDSVVLDNASGRATYNANDIARLYLAGPDARSIFASRTTDPAGTTGPPQVAEPATVSPRWRFELRPTGRGPIPGSSCVRANASRSTQPAPSTSSPALPAARKEIARSRVRRFIRSTACFSAG